MAQDLAIAPVEAATLRIRVVRGNRVMLDEDLAELYGVETRVLTQSVRRNLERFPGDFMFELTRAEWIELRRLLGSEDAHGGRRRPPLAFTEQGVAMLSSVLRGSRAIAVNVQIMRAFVRIREIMAESADLSHRLDEVERRYDEQFRVIIQAIQQLAAPVPAKNRKPIGFRVSESSED